MPDKKLGFVSIVMPSLNEEHYIRDAITSILPCDGEIDYEILIVDGGSTDSTCEIVQQLAKENPRIKLLHNPRRIQSAAMNLAAEAAAPQSRYLLRADCHAEYPPAFARHCIEALEKTEAASVVVPLLAAGRTCMQKAIAAAQNSPLGNGGSAHRRAITSRYVEHGHHAAFDRAVFQKLGGYDESFTHNEDAEYDVRVVNSGQSVYLLGEAPVRYYTRANLLALARQYANHGRGRASTLLKHSIRPRLRQMLPVAALLSNAAAVILAMLWSAAFLAIPLTYVALCMGWGAALAVRERAPYAALSGAAAMVMHMSWALGFLQRLNRAYAPKRLTHSETARSS
ncbi:MAG: glycosyltransferase family 2 protein [Alphaproteobacteria bacterium]